MRKLLTLILILGALSVAGQNANRSGFYLELGVGSVTGSSPVTSYSYDGKTGVITAHYAHGLAGSFGMGYRIRSGRYTAFDLKMQAQAAKEAPGSSMVGKLMPGIRVTTPELWRNFSIYITAHVGGAIATGSMESLGDYGYEYAVDTYMDAITKAIVTGKETDVEMFGECAFGAAYALGVGVNLSNHFYVGYVWDSQVMYRQMRATMGIRHWGMSAFRIGYKF